MLSAHSRRAGRLGSAADGAEVRTRLFTCITTADSPFILQQNAIPASQPSISISSRSHSATSGSRSNISSADASPGIAIGLRSESPEGRVRGGELRRSLADALQSAEHLHLAVCGVFFSAGVCQCSIIDYITDEATFKCHASSRCLYYFPNEVLINAVLGKYSNPVK